MTDMWILQSLPGFSCSSTLSNLQDDVTHTGCVLGLGATKPHQVGTLFLKVLGGSGPGDFAERKPRRTFTVLLINGLAKVVLLGQVL